MKLQLPFCSFDINGESPLFANFIKTHFFKVNNSPDQLFNITISFQKNFKPSNSVPNLEKKYFYDVQKIFIRYSRGKYSSFLLTKDSAQIIADPDFDPYFLYAFIIEPLYIVLCTEHHVSVIHASSLEKNNKATVFPAWRHTGKTHTILSKVFSGYKLHADDFSVIYKGYVYTFPKNLNLFSYNFKEFPQLLSKLSLRERVKIKLGLAAKTTLESLAKVVKGPLHKVFFRMAELSEVMTNTVVSPKNLNIVPGSESKLNEVVFLERNCMPGNLSQEEIDRKLTATIKFEFLEFTKLMIACHYFDINSNFTMSSFLKKYVEVFVENSKSAVKSKSKPGSL